ncbi:class I SAM-dependent methyltransferase [Parahaliea mediterranea]|uniref:Methyltransferase domain-containing protein n=1 Tax=Parahaliea mediterranea TaxID=651086 RepID=A0A939IKB8_9GAMM|nr:class I SAM-dependent methyltransferase [Parahaliea mediterranea]MBN7798584.1 methyltransferase domain-containing protein [Parahaliea mediterranea]
MVTVLGPIFSSISADVSLALEVLELPHDAALLDVGTGDGYCAIALALQGYQVLTGEPETDLSAYAGKNWSLNAEKVGVQEKIQFQAFDASKMPFSSQQFDAVFFFGVLHHVDENDRASVVREALRVTARNGAAIFFEPKSSMLEKIWAVDPDHPLPADPSNYLPARQPAGQHMTGEIMDISIYRNTLELTNTPRP